MTDTRRRYDPADEVENDVQIVDKNLVREFSCDESMNDLDESSKNELESGAMTSAQGTGLLSALEWADLVSSQDSRALPPEFLSQHHWCFSQHH